MPEVEIDNVTAIACFDGSQAQVRAIEMKPAHAGRRPEVRRTADQEKILVERYDPSRHRTQANILPMWIADPNRPLSERYATRVAKDCPVGIDPANFVDELVQSSNAILQQLDILMA